MANTEIGTTEPAHPSDVVALSEAMRRFRRALAKRRREFIVVFLVVAVTVQAAAFLLPARYAAIAGVLVKQSRASSRILSDPSDGSTVMMGAVSEEEVNSEVAILTSHEVLAQTVKSTGLDKVQPSLVARIIFAPLRAYDWMYAEYHHAPHPTRTDAAIQWLGRSITADRVKKSDVLAVTLVAGNPRVAESLLSNLLKNYLDRQIQVRAASGAAPFYSSQLQVLEDSLTQHEGNLRVLKRSIGAVDITEERNQQLALDARLREEASTLSRRLAEIDGMLRAYNNQVSTAMSGTDSTHRVQDSRLDAVKAEVLRLELEQLRLAARYTEGFPLVRENQEKLDAARATLKREQENVLEYSPTLRAADQEKARLMAERVGVTSRLQALGAQMQQSRARLVQLDNASLEAERDERVIHSAEDRLRVYLSSGERARADSALDQRGIANVSIVQQPTALPKPVSPKKLIVLLMSVFGGLLAALATCIWLELRQQGLASVLASIVPPRQHAA